MKNEITFIDPFAGIGGFRLGLERVGFKCVWSCEIDRWCEVIYRKNFGESFDAKDVREVNTKTIPDFDILCAGFPCQSFSIAGKRKGFDDTRGILFWEICRIAREKRPRLLLLENVKGLLSHEAGRTFAIILLSLDDLGYDAEWQVLNSKDFGVPQNRERVFVVGHLRGEGGQEILPLKEGDRVPHTEKQGKQGEGQRVSSTIDSRYRALRNAGETYIVKEIESKFQKTVYGVEGLSPTVREGHGDVVRILDAGSIGQRVYDSKGIAVGVKAHGGGLGAKTGLYAIYDDYNHRVREDGNCGAVRQTFANKAVGNGCKLIRDGLIRKLTPTECERLQGFPDNWTQGVSDTQRYRMLGNAVTVNVVETLGKEIRRMLDAEG